MNRSKFITIRNSGDILFYEFVRSSALRLIQVLGKIWLDLSQGGMLRVRVMISVEILT